MVTPFLDSSVVHCGPLQPWGTLAAPQPPAFLLQPSGPAPPGWFPAQQLSSMVGSRPAPPEALAPGVFANQLEVELGMRAITLPSAAYLDVEALEQQLGVPRPAADDAPAPAEGTKATKKKGRKKGGKKASAEAEPNAGPPVALAAITHYMADILEDEPQGVPAEELRVAASKLPGYSLMLEAYARPGSFKALKGAPAELAPFLHLLCTQMPAFTVKTTGSFLVRRGAPPKGAQSGGGSKKWVPNPKAKAFTSAGAGSASNGRA